MLIELPSADEFADNIVVFWRPEAPLVAGSQNRFDYRLTWGLDEVEELPLARVVSTRSGLSILDARERVFVVDFDLGMIEFPSVVPRLEASAGEIKSLSDHPPPRRRHRPGRLPLRRRRRALRRVPPLARQRRTPAPPRSGSTAGACDKPQPGRSGSDRPGPCARG